MRLSPVILRHSFFGVFALSAALCYGQANGLGESLTLSNSSFEDVPRQGHPPRGWYDCGFSDESPVDVHPASANPASPAAYFGVDARAFDGNTYLGMVVRDNDTYEAVSQRLLGGPLRAGKCYTFSIYLARETQYMSSSRRVQDSLVNYKTPAKLRIFGGQSYCNRGEVIAESAPVKNSEWLQYNFRFEPKRDHDYIVLEAYYRTPVLFPYNGNVLVDAAGKINPVACDNEIPEPDSDEPSAEEMAMAEQPVEDVVATVESSARSNTPAPPSRPQRQPTASPAPPSKPVAKLQGLTRSDLRAGSTVRIEKLFFKADSSAVTPESRTVLDEIFTFLDSNDDVVIEVGGHTSGGPEHAYCDWLSSERAESVVHYLTGRGISEGRLYAKGYGKRKPLATNRTMAGRKRNQRVEIKVLSMGG